jgi:hypothetical protein
MRAAFIVLVLAATNAAHAQTSTVIVDPTQPQKKTTTTSSGGKVLLDMAVAPVCGTPRQTVIAVGASAITVPASALSTRRWVDICVSIENETTPTVKCRVDGSDPVIGVAGAGDPLAKGDCVRYPVTSSQPVRCISNTPATAVTTLECS